MRKQCKRTHWIADPEFSPMQRAAHNAARLTDAEWVEQVLPVQVAVDQLCQGNWSMEHCWAPIFECMTRIESMLKLKRAADHGLIDDGQQVFVSTMDRMNATGSTAFRADEMKVIREIGQVYGGLLKEITHKEFRDAIAHSRANVKRIVNQKSKNITRHGDMTIERRLKA